MRPRRFAGLPAQGAVALWVIASGLAIALIGYVLLTQPLVPYPDLRELIERWSLAVIGGIALLHMGANAFAVQSSEERISQDTGEKAALSKDVILRDSLGRTALGVLLAALTWYLMRDWSLGYALAEAERAAMRSGTPLKATEAATHAAYHTLLCVAAVHLWCMARAPIARSLQEYLSASSQAIVAYAFTAGAVSITALAIDLYRPETDPLLQLWAATGVGLLMWPLGVLVQDKARQQSNFKKGRKLITVADAQRQVTWRRKSTDRGVTLFGVQYPSSVTLYGVSLSGRKGSGKTQLLKTLLYQTLDNVGRGRDTRAFIHEAKEILPFLYDLSNERQRRGEPPLVIKDLNPRHPDCVGWDMARDIGEDLQLADAIATIFIPHEKNSNNRFFSDAARGLLTKVMESFILTNIERRERGEKPFQWTFRHVCLAMRSPGVMAELFRRHEHTADGLELLNRVNNDVLTTVQTYMRPFSTIAAAWDGKELVSLVKWRDDPVGSILVVGWDPVAKPAIQALNRVLFERMTQIVLKGPNNSPKVTHIVLDEFTNMGQLTGFSDFITQCRSKGGHVTLAFQYYSAIKEQYGDEVATQIVGEMGTKILLKASDAQAKWQSETIGDALEDVIGTGASSSETSGYQSSSATSGRSETRTEQVRRVVLDTEFTRIPLAGPQTGIGGYAISDYFAGVYRYTEPWTGLLAEVANLGRVEEEAPAPTGKSQLLRSWSDTEREKFGLPVAPEVRTPGSDEPPVRAPSGGTREAQAASHEAKSAPGPRREDLPPDLRPDYAPPTGPGGLGKERSNGASRADELRRRAEETRRAREGRDSPKPLRDRYKGFRTGGDELEE